MSDTHNTKQPQAKVDLNTYGNLIHLVSGQSTLRDLSLKLNQDVIQLAYSLAPYEQQGILEFQEIPDLANNFTTQEYMTQFLQIVSSKGKFTVACIDDNNQIHHSENSRHWSIKKCYFPTSMNRTKKQMMSNIV